LVIVIVSAAAEEFDRRTYQQLPEAMFIQEL
jgi:hypothetical protein